MKSAIYTAQTDDGLELPIFDVTHPAFYANDSQQAALTAEFVGAKSPAERLLARLPERLRRALMQRMFRLGPERM